MNRKIIAVVAILLILGAGAFFFLRSGSETVIYREVTVKQESLIQYVQSTGTVSPQNRLEIKPPVAGRIEEVLVKEGDEVKKGKILAWISSNERAALLDSVRTQGEAEIKKWESLYRPTPVIAPINGTIILRNVEAGQSFANTDPIFVMADRLTVKAQVDETDIARVKINQAATIILDAYPENPLEGKVVHLAYDATLTNNVTTYQVDILPDDPPKFLRSGMTSNVNIEVDRKDNVLTLPIVAVTEDETGKRVLTGTAEKNKWVPVETGIDNGKKVEILSGLMANEKVLIKQSSLKGKKGGSNPLFPGGRGGKRR